MPLNPKYGELSGHAAQQDIQELSDMLVTLYNFVLHDVILQDGYAPGTVPSSDQEIFDRLTQAWQSQEPWIVQSKAAQRELVRLRQKFAPLPMGVDPRMVR